MTLWAWRAKNCDLKSGMILIKKKQLKINENSWSHLHTLLKGLFFTCSDCPVTFVKILSEENSWNQFNNWKKSSQSQMMTNFALFTNSFKLISTKIYQYIVHLYSRIKTPLKYTCTQEFRLHSKFFPRTHPYLPITYRLFPWIHITYYFITNRYTYTANHRNFILSDK